MSKLSSAALGRKYTIRDPRTQSRSSSVFYAAFSKLRNAGPSSDISHPSSNCKKLGLLLWKNYLLQKRHKIQTILEILLPLIFVSILVVIRSVLPAEEYPHGWRFKQYNPSAITGTAIEIHLQSYVQTKVNAQPETLYYAPNNAKTTEIMTILETSFLQFSLIKTAYPSYKTRAFKSEEDLVNSYSHHSAGVLGAIIFNSGTTGDEITYTIRLPAKQRSVYYLKALEIPQWFTDAVYPKLPRLRPRSFPEDYGGVPGYHSQAFTFLQFAVDASIIKSADPSLSLRGSFAGRINQYSVFLQRFPYPPFILDRYVDALQIYLPFVIMMSFVYPVVNISKFVVVEKERRLKESMKMIGIPNHLHWAAWFIKHFIFLLISLFFIVVLLKIKPRDKLAIITHTDPTILILLLLAYVFSSIHFAFMISTLFSKANSASTGAGLLMILAYLPYMFLAERYENLSKAAKLVWCLFSNVAMSFGFHQILTREGAGEGSQWKNILSSTTEDSFNLLHCISMLILDGFLYFLIAIYIEGVFPGEFGIPLPWYFPVSKSYWRGRKQPENPIIDDPTNEEETGGNFESSPTNLTPGITIRGLSKSFGQNNAVVNLNLDLFENQITVLLGHNGAGKTTTVSMLTGLFPPTSGYATINDCDIRTDMDEIRNGLGICPQHNVLFDELTCEEHLKFFCRVKGCRNVDAEVSRMLNALNMTKKRFTKVGELSGGMKRKLSVGQALVGGSEIVLLDEPTSGMDPDARRSTWDLITMEKWGRTILLTTHFMDEADLLGDRIAILAFGQLQTVGSSLFLKKRYGAGYSLLVDKKEGCDIGKITEVVRSHLKNPEMDDLEFDFDLDVGAELSYSLPDNQSSQFGPMFDELERRKEELMIDSYAASITTMEEVFMRVGMMAEEKKQSEAIKITLGTGPPSMMDLSIVASSTSLFQSGSFLNLSLSQSCVFPQNNFYQGFALHIRQLRAMLVKKALYTVRNVILLIVQIIIPVALLVMAMTVIKTYEGEIQNPNLQINLNKFSRPVTTLSCNGLNDAVCREYAQFGQESHSEVKRVTAGSSLSEFIIQRSTDSLSNVNQHYIIGLQKDDIPKEDSVVLAGKMGFIKIWSKVGLIESLTSLKLGNHGNNTLQSFYNNQPYHAQPIALNFLMNAIFRAVTSNSRKRLTVNNYPLPNTHLDKAESVDGITTIGFLLGFIMMFGLNFLVSSFVVFLIKERESKAKLLQFVSGAGVFIFWSSHFIFDFFVYLIASIVLVAVIAAFQVDSFKHPDILASVSVLLVTYGWVVIPWMYLCSFLFHAPATGFAWVVILNIVAGVAPFLTIVILQIPSLDLLDTAKTLNWVFLIFPNYNLGYGMKQLSINAVLHEICPKLISICKSTSASQTTGSTVRPNPCCTDYPYSYLHMHPAGIGRNILSLFINGFFGFILLFIVEAKVFQTYKCATKRNRISQEYQKLADDPAEDPDVAAEAKKIRSTDEADLFKSYGLVVRNLSKSYRAFTAVHCLNLGVKKRECFGLLGVNGAGKTTTFKMLTGDLSPSSGDAFVCGHSITSDIKSVQKNLGYCPQFDALIDELTGRETIQLFARLRGIRENEINDLADNLGGNLLFSELMDKAVKTYSGGNKRKLSTAVALIGHPPLVFLDEPTTGMDPVARRHLWNCITKVRKSGTSIILTSHSMEECEALCTRLVIMVNGEFCCLGSTTHLKSKFGRGYTITAQITTKTAKNKQSLQEMQTRRSTLGTGIALPPPEWQRELKPLRRFIERSFPGANLKDAHPGYLHYHLTNPELTWGLLFRKMEEANEKFRLEAYSVGQTSLEQIFLNFAKGQATDQ